MSVGTLRAMASGRHLRPGRRRLRPLLGRRRLARPPLREDALRQRAARPRLPARLAGDAATRCCARSARRRSTGRCARCAARRAASPPRSTPTPRASRASSTSGASTSCARCWRRRRRRGDRLVRRDARGGNFEGANILTRGPGATERAPDGAPRARDAGGSALYDVRAQRVWPGLDDKRLTSWNALMIAALADAGAVLERDDYLDAARACGGLRARARCATTTAGCCAPGRTAART